MYKPFGRILYGGDYNPNQWPKEVWEQDMAYFKDARINSATINVFSWAKIQPSEEEYYFDELDEIVEMLSKENYDIVLATSTGAMPACSKNYPSSCAVKRQHMAQSILCNKFRFIGEARTHGSPCQGSCQLPILGN